MGAVSTMNLQVRSAQRRVMQRESEHLDNDAGRAFRLYLAARVEGRTSGEITLLKVAYETAARSCRNVRLIANGSLDRNVVAA